MALKVTQTTTLTGQSLNENGQAVVTWTASIPSANGQTNVNMYIVDQDYYDKNKAAIRKDNSDFMDQVYAVEDGTNTEAE